MRIKVSEKYGVNPSLSQCFFCGETKNEIILRGRLMGDKEAPKMACYSMEPCDTCKGYMEKGIMFISVKDKDSSYRTGKLCVIKEEKVKLMIKEPMLTTLIKMRACFINDSDWHMLGLPEKEVNT